MLELGMREIIAQAAAAAETDCEPGSRTFAGGFTMGWRQGRQWGWGEQGCKQIEKMDDLKAELAQARETLAAYTVSNADLKSRLDAMTSAFLVADTLVKSGRIG